MLQTTHENEVRLAFESIVQQAIAVAPKIKESFENLDNYAPLYEQAKKKAKEIMEGKSSPIYDKSKLILNVEYPVKTGQNPVGNRLHEAFKHLSTRKVDEAWEEVATRAELKQRLSEYGLTVQMVTVSDGDNYTTSLRFSLIS